MSLEHCAKILTKNKIRECDKEELRLKEMTHEKVMKETDKDSYELKRLVQRGTGKSKEEG